MPFNIWCGSNAEDPDPNVRGCRKHIGIGVRYNAEKTRVAMYYTTPVYQVDISNSWRFDYSDQLLFSSSRCGATCVRTQSPSRQTPGTWTISLFPVGEGWNRDGTQLEMDR